MQINNLHQVAIAAIVDRKRNRAETNSCGNVTAPRFRARGCDMKIEITKIKLIQGVMVGAAGALFQALIFGGSSGGWRSA
jgi:hypothetical protein